MKSNPEKTNYWRQHIEALKVSGLSRTAYCEANQIKLTTLDYWRQKFNFSEKKNDESWIPIKIAEDRSPGIDLHVGRIAIVVKPGFDRELLIELLQTINAIC
jgi:hypothetical protein